MGDKKILCNFCGDEVKNGMAADKEGSISICEKCLVDGVNNILLKNKMDGMSNVDMFNMVQEIKYGVSIPKMKDYKPEKVKYDYKAMIPSEVKEKLDEYVIGQEHAKRVLSVASYNHYKMLGALGEVSEDIDLEKSNILLLGPTGTGKTLLVKTLSKILDVPMAMTDATALTENGYVGDDVESIVEKLYLASGKDVAKTERGIIYIDEIDKIAADFESSRKDVGGAGVQQALLKIIEGHKIHFTPQNDKKNPMASSIEIDTSNILFIVGGAFADLDYNSVTHESIRDYGIIPELLGRLPIITQTEELTLDAMLRILTEPRNSLIKQYQELFNLENIELIFTEEAMEAIAKEAMDKKTGARSLKHVVENIMLDLAYEAPSIKNLKQAVVGYRDGSIVRNFIKNKERVEA